ncbi:MAG: hypothetical protein ED859_06180 [Desulfuromonadales bacterium]|nr:MAG: hypothetical protein ED859_06180 [Desulfuromonadales bacterium]
MTELRGIPRLLREHRRLVSIALALCGVAAAVTYLFCTDACSRVAGSVAGVGLPWLGIGFMAAVAGAALLRFDNVVFSLLSAGVGVEAFLVGRQVIDGRYCIWCLLFAAAVLLLFVLNFDRRRMRLLAAASVAGFFAMFAGFAADPIPAYAATAPLVPTYGSGPVKVRLYTDYFCGPCASIEKDVEAAMAALVRRNAVSVTFIDTPLHRETPLYAAYYLYALNGGNDLDRALRARAVLFDAARKGIAQRENLEGHLRANGVSYTPFEYRPVVNAFNKYFKEDRITTTPTMVVYRDGKRETFVGKSDILKGIERLKGKG